jgi:hypothetical protein
LCAVYTANQAVVLCQKNEHFSRPRSADVFLEELKKVLPELPPSKQLYFVFFPGNWLHAQFLESQLQVAYGDREVRATVLVPRGFTLGRTVQSGPREIRLRGRHPVMDHELAFMPWRDLSSGRRYAMPGGEVEVVAGRGKTCTELRFCFDTDLAGAALIRFDLPKKPAVGLSAWMRTGTFHVQRY